MTSEKYESTVSRGAGVINHQDTVYPKKYAHGFVVLCFVVVMQSFIMNSLEELQLNLIYVGQHHELNLVENCSYICFTYFSWTITSAIDDWVISFIYKK